jgi:hypothetical protein
MHTGAHMTQPTQPIRAALYARVSTNGQTTENQLLELRQAAQRLGWVNIQSAPTPLRVVCF